MDSLEILSAITEATSPSEVEKVNFKEEGVSRSDFYYENDMKFQDPLIIRGTNKQLLPFENLVSFNGEDKCSVDELTKMCGNVDNNLNIHTVDNISDIEMTFVNDSKIILFDKMYNDGVGRYFIIPTSNKNTGVEAVAFKSWSEILKIPYTYSKKNPGFLNEANFKYWQTFLTAAQDQQIPVDFIYMKEPIAATLDDGEDPILAYLVVNILKSQTVCEKRGVISNILHPLIDERVPKVSCIIDNIQKQIVNLNPEIKTTVEQYSLGYTGTNKGRHYVRLVLEGTDAEFDIDGEKMLPAITVESDFIGKSKDFGEVILTFSLFKEICSNGLVVNWTESQKNELQESFVLNHCKNLGVSEQNLHYMEIVEEAKSKFNTIFSMSGIRLPINIANSVVSKSLFGEVLKFFLTSTFVMKQSLEKLNEATFEGVKDKDFVSTVHNLGASMQFSSDIIKYLLIEYLVGNMEYQDQTFQTPMDIVDFLTYICRAFDSTVQLDVEKKAYMFAYSLMQILIYKKKSEESVYENYLRKINQNML